MNFLKKLWIWIPFSVLFTVACIHGCSTYNGLVKQDNGLEKAWADVEIQYQRRLDLIPNLVNTVKGYASHEKETLMGVTKARAGLDKAMEDAKATAQTDPNDEQSFNRYAQAQSALDKQLDIYVNAVQEAYPDLKANENFLSFQDELTGTENRITQARRDYTEKVKEYNLAVRRFPSNIWAGMFGFSKRPQFQAEAGAEKAPTVSFD